MSSAPLETPLSRGPADDAESPDASRRAFDLAPDLSLAAIRAHEGPILVDLDETLYLRNSTEDFIDGARPKLLALVLLRLFDVVRPWRWTGGEASRDVWRVRLILALFPWTARSWRARAPRLAKTFVNSDLLAALQRVTGPTYIVTVGFAGIVAPLAAAWGFSDAHLIACPLSFGGRRRGKLQSALDSLGADCVRRALLVTDSLDDLPLLRHCARGIRTLWPGATYRRAFADVYLPGQYIAQIKHPGEHYLRRAVLQEDYIWWVLSSIALATTPVSHVVGLFLLLVSFWVIYEMGYADNDMIAAKYEAQPALTKEFHEFSVATPRIQPWAWSLAFAVAGIAVIRREFPPPITDIVVWTGGLVATSLWFGMYNRANKPTRVWMYAVLQLARTAIFVLIVPILPIGAMALAAQVLTRWTQYFIYRLVGKNWPMQAHFGITRLGTFVLLALILSMSLGWGVLLSWTTLMLVGWSIFRARRELSGVFARSVLLDRAAATARGANDRS